MFYLLIFYHEFHNLDIENRKAVSTWIGRKSLALGSCRLFARHIGNRVLIRIYFHRSANVGIFSQVKQYYTEKTTEQLSDIGTGEEDTYIIVEGDEKD